MFTISDEDWEIIRSAAIGEIHYLENISTHSKAGEQAEVIRDALDRVQED